MNGTSKPGDYPLLSLRGRHFSRLNPKAVETFHLTNCQQCQRAIKTNVLILSEPSDERLMREGLHQLKLYPEELPLIGTGILGYEQADLLCPECYIKWLKPTEATSHE